MLAVLTIDQRDSRRDRDRVEDLLTALAELAAFPSGAVLAFERTAGDEVQGMLGSAEAVLDVATLTSREGHWSIGVGLGSVNQPLPSSTRSAGGPAFERARVALDRAKGTPELIALEGPDPRSAGHAETALAVLGDLLLRRSEQGWAAADLMAAGLTQSATAQRLGVSKQAVSQRLSAAMWQRAERLRALTIHLLEQAADPPDARSGAPEDARSDTRSDAPADASTDRRARG